jgi:cation diffusion facilitator CzcD-associated flavoprotein CzcO
VPIYLADKNNNALASTNTLIVGASVSGLACAACLQKQNIEYCIIEKYNQVAFPWRNHYDRLHLHTSKIFSHLPYKKFDKKIPRYPARQDVVDYLEDYKKTFQINPCFETEAIRIKNEGTRWITQTTKGSFESKNVIMATGMYSKAKRVHFRGMELFTGEIMYSSEYKSGKAFAGQHVLVVGFGNSSCEIAIDLYEQGALPAMSVRSAVSVVPRDVLGIPVLSLSRLLSCLPPRIADTVSAPLRRLSVGNISKLGLRKLPYGPMQQISKDGKVPVLDIGTLQLIRSGQLKIFDDIDYMEEKTIYFKDGKKDNFDAIVAGTGYERDYGILVDVDKSRFDDLHLCAGKQKYFGNDGLYFCGFWLSPAGQIREIASDSKKIAKDIAKKEKRS